MPNYYQILDLPYNASASQVKRAYREKAKNCHPDVSRSEKAKREFQLLNQAYSVLSDEQKRRKYDILLLYRRTVIRDHFNKKARRERQRRARNTGPSGNRAKSMTSTSRGYRYYKPDPSPLFKFGIYATGILFGVNLFLLTAFSLFFNGWPLASVFLLVPASILTYQGWNGVFEHRNGAGRNVLEGWGWFIKLLNKRKNIR